MSVDLVAEARAEIDGIDRQLLELVNRRLEVVRRLHDHKVASGIPLRDPGREESIVRELQGVNRGPLSDDGVQALVHQVLELTRRELHGE